MSDGEPRRMTEQKSPSGGSRWWLAFVNEGRDAPPAVLQSALLIHRLNRGVAFDVMSSSSKSRVHVGRLFGKPKCSQSCHLFSNGPSLGFIGHAGQIGILSQFQRPF